MCGNGERGQLGLGIVTKKEYKPMKVDFKDENGKSYASTPKFKQVTCGYFHTGFLTGNNNYLVFNFFIESGVIYVTGDNTES